MWITLRERMSVSGGLQSSPLSFPRMNHIYFIWTIFVFLSSWSAVTQSAKVRHVTHLNEISDLTACSSLRSAMTSGYDLIILGLQAKNDTKPTPTSATNPIMILNYFNSSVGIFQDDDIVVFNDGSDVLFAANRNNLESTFLKIERNNTIFFAAERLCWPGSISCIEPHFSVQSSFKYANARGFIGRYKSVLKFVKSWVQLLLLQPILDRNDQLALHDYMKRNEISETEVKIQVDHNCTIFQTSSMTQLGSEKWAVVDVAGPYMRSDGVIFNSETNTEPIFSHINSNADRLVEMERHMWAIEKTHISSDSSHKYKTTCLSTILKYPLVNSCKADKMIRLNCHEPRQPQLRKKAFNADRIWVPIHIVSFPIRNDATSGKPVSRGRMELLKKDTRYPLAEYNQILQCPKTQPELYGKGGALSLAKYIPLTSQTLVLVASYMEGQCQLYKECREKLPTYFSGGYPMILQDSQYLGRLSQSKMFRIMNGSLYYDWPWGVDRFKVAEREQNYKVPILDILRTVSDIPDSVFFCGGETNVLPPNIPVPHFSSAPRASRSSDIPGLWNAAFLREKQRYKDKVFQTVSQIHDQKMSAKVIEEDSNDDLFTEINSSAKHTGLPASWKARQDKAAFFGSMTDEDVISDHAIARQVVMNIGIDYPEHLDAKFGICFHLTDVNPHSDEKLDCTMTRQQWIKNHGNFSVPPPPFGYGKRSIRAFHPMAMDIDEYMLSYRYLIVIGGVVSADRLNTFLAHSGAVIMLQEADFLYHYSALLKPWVHYGETVRDLSSATQHLALLLHLLHTTSSAPAPLTYCLFIPSISFAPIVPIAFNAADVLEKILWLKSHPKLAHRLALNAHNFGASYLRLEDYYCYQAAALDAVSEIADPSALEPFNATLLLS